MLVLTKKEIGPKNVWTKGGDSKEKEICSTYSHIRVTSHCYVSCVIKDLSSSAHSSVV